MKGTYPAVVLFVLLFALVGRGFAQADAFAARARILLPAIEKLTPQAVSEMPRTQRLELFSEVHEIFVGLEKSLMSQPGMNEEKMLGYLAAQGIEKIFSNG